MRTPSPGHPPRRRLLTAAFTALVLLAAGGVSACGGSADAGADGGKLRIGYQRFGGLSLVKARGAAPDVE